MSGTGSRAALVLRASAVALAIGAPAAFALDTSAPPAAAPARAAPPALLAGTPDTVKASSRATAPEKSETAKGTSAAASEPRIFLTSRAPYGQPGASDRLTAPCADTTVMDTLYLCFDPGRDAEHFNGISATVYFWPAGSDTLGGHWKFGDGLNFKGLKVQFAPAAVPGTEYAWEASGVTSAAYRSTKAAGRLAMITASPAGEGPPVRSGAVYGVARLIVPRPARGSADCDRPICIDWAEAFLAFRVGELVQASRGQRFVTWNSPDARVCAPMRGAPQPWQPGREKR